MSNDHSSVHKSKTQEVSKQIKWKRTLKVMQIQTVDLLKPSPSNPLLLHL